MSKDRKVTDVLDVLDNVNISYRGSIALYKNISARIEELGYTHCSLHHDRIRNELILPLHIGNVFHKRLFEFIYYDAAPGKKEFACTAALKSFGVCPFPEGCTYTARLVQDPHGHDFVVIHLWNQIAKEEDNG